MKHTSPVFTGVLAAALLAALAPTALAQQQGAPPPAATGTDVPTSYFGPPPSEIDRQLVGPVQLLRSGRLDRKRGTIRLPLYLGHMRDGRNVWYILTDTRPRPRRIPVRPRGRARPHAPPGRPASRRLVRIANAGARPQPLGQAAARSRSS